MDNIISMILGGLANVVVVLLVAPFFQGVLRKVTARIQSRQGPPIWQPYYDTFKLLGKEDIESGEAPVMQRFAAYLSLASILTVACLVPMGFAAPMNGAGDAVRAGVGIDRVTRRRRHGVLGECAAAG